MNKLIMLVFAVFSVELARRILIWLATDSNGSDGAATYDGRHDGASALLNRLADTLSIENLDANRLFLLALAAALASVGVGMVAHLLLGNRAFGATVNGYVMFFCALFSGVAWLSFGPGALTQHEHVLLVVAALGALSGLFACISLRSAVFAHLERRLDADPSVRRKPSAKERLAWASRRPEKA